MEINETVINQSNLLWHEFNSQEEEPAYEALARNLWLYSSEYGICYGFRIDSTGFALWGTVRKYIVRDITHWRYDVIKNEIPILPPESRLV